MGGNLITKEMGGNHITKQEKLVIEIKKTDQRKKEGKKSVSLKYILIYLCFIEIWNGIEIEILNWIKRQAKLFVFNWNAGQGRALPMERQDATHN